MRALEQAGGVRKRAAALLGISFRSLRYRLEKLGIDKGDDAVDDAATTSDPPLRGEISGKRRRTDSRRLTFFVMRGRKPFRWRRVSRRLSAPILDC